MGFQMKSTVLARLAIALLLIAGSLSVALVAESASAAPRYAVNLTISDSRPDVGENVRLSGKVIPKAPGKKVLVQGKAAGTGWVTIATRTLSKRSTYKAVGAVQRSGRLQLRVVKPATRKAARRHQPGPRPPDRGKPGPAADHHHDAARRRGRRGVLRNGADRRQPGRIVHTRLRQSPRRSDPR